MEVSEARRVLGVHAGADDVAVRAAFLQLVRRHHPDVGGNGDTVPAATATTARIIDAYRTLRRADPEPPRSGGKMGPERSKNAARTAVAWSEGDTVVVAAPANETWVALMEAAHGLGEVSYVDRSAALLEVVVEFIDHPVCSVVFTLQGRSDGTTHAFCTVEALGGDPEPPTHLVAALVAERVAAVFEGPNLRP